jgi:hypothetical protein
VNDEKADWTRRAIDVMTAWAATRGDAHFAAKRVVSYSDEEPDGAMKLTVGFINLTAMLLVELEAFSGADMSVILQDVAKFTLEPSAES